jgi:hypothetical protein
MSQRYIAIIMGVACISQIPHAIFSKRYLITFCNSSKAISDSFASCRKVFNYSMQFSFIFTNFWDFASGIESLFASCKREFDTF